ncbi:MAG TPA: ATP-binding protein, partial [Acidobacteriaceae bacterium]|nr:ATP-binding protein [Acidobacteriaceae bacterium]
QSMALPTDLPPGVSVLHTPEPEVLEALRRIRQLDGLSDAEYLWLIQHSWEFAAPAGTRLFSDGDPATHMTILLQGEVQVRRQHVARGSLFIGRSGQITGVLPFSRMKTSGGSGYVSEAVWALQVPRDLFPEMLVAIPSMGQRCVSILLDRVREVTRLEQQSEKLSAMGKLAANLAHELNNPASAAQRASSNLMEELRAFGKVSFEAGRLCLTNEQEERYIEWNRNIRCAIEGRTKPQNPIDAGALEERLNRWLEPRKLSKPWTIAPVFAEAGVEPEELAVLDTFLNVEAANVAVTHFASTLRAESMTGAVLESTARIFELIRAIQQYSHMDQAPLQDIDLAQSLENTLTMLHYRMNQVKVVREYDPGLPRVTANGGELNQIWMALLENALDAMQDRGTIRVTTQNAGDMVRVEICDDGPGIPAELHSRIFEPFFTTKPPGKGAGLSLDTVNRIVSRYRGFINVESKPGFTCFQIRIPLQQAGAY